MNSTSFYMNSFLADIDIVTEDYLNDIRLKMIVKYYNYIKKPYIWFSCDTDDKKLIISISLRFWNKLFSNRKKLEQQIQLDCVKILPNYRIEFIYV